MAEQQPVIIDDQMAIGRGNVYVPRSQGVVIVSENRGQRAGSVKNLIENRTALTWQMYCDKNCRGEIAGEIFWKETTTVRPRPPTRRWPQCLDWPLTSCPL